jgi:hypothetical protein
MKIRLTENAVGRKKGGIYEVIPNKHAEENGYFIAYTGEGYHGPDGFQVQPYQCEVIEEEAKQRYERNELIEWVNLIEEAKSIGLTPKEVRNFIEEGTK